MTALAASASVLASLGLAGFFAASPGRRAATPTQGQVQREGRAQVEG